MTRRRPLTPPTSPWWTSSQTAFDLRYILRHIIISTNEISRRISYGIFTRSKLMVIGFLHTKICVSLWALLSSLSRSAKSAMCQRVITSWRKRAAILARYITGSQLIYQRHPAVIYHPCGPFSFMPSCHFLSAPLEIGLFVNSLPFSHFMAFPGVRLPSQSIADITHTRIYLQLFHPIAPFMIVYD